MAAPAPAVGSTFEHARQIVGSPKAGTSRPMVCTVTKVTATRVYFRNETGFLSHVPRNSFTEGTRP